MTQSHRINGGLIDRNKTLSFDFNGEQFDGYEGDTLASALLANGQKLVGRSFKYHRPRGIFTAGSEEPNALVQLRKGAYQEPNTRATVVELFEGLTATSQNHRGSLKYDFMAVTDLLSPFLSAGFYYKTFMWPKAFWEKVYEPIIRSSAGLGRVSEQEDPDCYDKGFLHCDLLVIGSGAAGLVAALNAGRAGARVILADEDFRMGGRLNAETYAINDLPCREWAQQTLDELHGMPNVRLMPRTTIYGAYDHGVYGALERKNDHLAEANGKPRQVLWRIYSKRAMLSAGSTERPIAFGNNDRPGIMLAGSVRAYANRWGVTSGKQVAIFTNNDDGWRTASDLVTQGVSVSAVIDTRAGKAAANIAGAEVFMGERVVDTKGRHGIKSLTLSNGQVIEADCLAVSGGWSPNVHLTCHQRGRPQWRDDIAAFVPGGAMPPGMTVVGAASGSLTLHAGMAESLQASNTLLDELGFTASGMDVPNSSDEASGVQAFWYVKESTKRGWLDLQNDVTVKDVKLAHVEGFRSVELLKRYTTLGMATDQGKTANIPALAVMAECTGKTIPETGTTIFRPPYTPIPLGALAGRSRGKDFRPYRHTPSHQWAEEQGAVFVETGMWLRAQWYPQPGETHWRESVDREVRQTRNSVGVCDVTTLGKIDVQGRDAQEFLHRIYANNFATLKVGMVRYGLMLREDGVVYDDGTTARMSENHFVMTTTTANAVLVYRNMEFCRQCLWPELDVHLISATEQWAQFAVAGPNARKVLEKVVDEADISNEAFPFMACAELTVCGGKPARLFRISFSGELAYEIAVPTRYGDGMIRALMQAGEAFGIAPYGTEALGVMRIEKGHPAGNELNGQTTALNLGLAGMLAKKSQSADSIGNVLSKRPEMNRDDALRLVGFFPVDREQELKAGVHFLSKGSEANTANDEGWMSSVAWSPELGHSIGLGLIKRGHERIGEVVTAYDALRDGDMDVEIVSPHFVDPKGERLRV